MKILVEHVEFKDLTILNEGTGKDLYISGIFAEAELKNRNGRIYPKSVMENAVNKYVNEYVTPKRALGELSHPEGRPQVKPELASHLITSLKMEGSKVIGKAKVLNTPQGQILRGLLEGGVQLGVSTRALGSVKIVEGIQEVQSDFQLFAIDAVSDPSSINAFVQAVNESKEWLVTDDGRILEKFKSEVDRGKLTEDAKIRIFKKFLDSISAYK